MHQDTVRIIDTTLREGEQFALASWTTGQKLDIATALDSFGVEYLELTSPVASPQSEHDLRTIAALPLRAGILTHTRCDLRDIRLAVDCGVRGVNLLFGTSSLLQQHSHGRSISELLAEVATCVAFLQDAGVEVRFSCEDAFRTDPADLLHIYTAVAALGVQRVGIADTIGVATPADVAELVGHVRAAVRCDIEFHGHNDGGCAIANAHAAWLAGATHLDTTILGIGERNGIAALSGLIARLYLSNPAAVAHYHLDQLPAIDAQVAQMLGIAVPFNACLTSQTAFTHKAGLHTKAMLRDANTYQAFDPAVFGRASAVLVGHRLTGRHAVAQQALTLGIALAPEQLVRVTEQIKAAADERPLADHEVDAIIRAVTAENWNEAGSELRATPAVLHTERAVNLLGGSAR